MKRLYVFIVALLLLYSCKKDNNDCNEAIPFCNEAILIIISQYVDVIMLYPNWETAECHGILNYTEGECDSN